MTRFFSQCSPCHRVILSTAITTCVALGLVSAAAAASGRRVVTVASGAAGKLLEPSSAPVLAVVSISEQKITVWSADGQVARSSVSTGMIGHSTPTGVFSVIGKERYHESNLYSSAPMPFMQRITWSGIALHAGNLPGYAASHGCIRLPDNFAQKLYGMTRMGMRVVISDRDIVPVAIAHPALPAPTFVRETQIAAAGHAYFQSGIDGSSGDGRMQLGGPSTASGKLLNPMERGKLEQGIAKIAALEAEADAYALLEIAQVRGNEARVASDLLRTVEGALSALRAGRDKALEGSTLATATGEEKARAQTASTALEAAYASAMARRTDMLKDAEIAEAAAFSAAAEAKAAVLERDALEHSARVATRATEPVSIFVSRKNHRIYVRQGFEPVFEADVEILDQQTPLGTHVFTAVETASESGKLRWTSLSVPDAGTADAPRARGSRSSKLSANGLQSIAWTEPRDAPPLPPTAANALSRIKFSDQVLQKISEKLWVGASLIVSDHGVSHETGKGTDFVVLTRSSSGE